MRMHYSPSFSIYRILLMLLVGLKSAGVFAENDAAPKPFVIPEMTTPVQDQAGILSPRMAEKLSNVLLRLYESGGSQIGVLTVPSLGDSVIEEASIKVTDKWKLGKRGKDNGVLLLIAPNERRVRIEVGKGLEGVLTDAYARRIINQVITPAFKENDFDGGIAGAVAQIISVTDPEFDLQSAGMQSSRRHKRGSSMNPIQGLGVFILLILFAVFAVIHRILQAFGLVPRSSYYGGSSRGGWGGGGGFGGGGGGSWGGGGGGFSGGGSSGEW